MALRIFNALFLIAFVLSAAVQYNDPDSVRWIVIYGLAAGMCLAQQWRLLHRLLPALMLIGSLVWIAYLLPNIVGQVSWDDIIESVSMKTKAVEEAREIGGLALIAMWSGILVWRNAIDT